ncbi:hypothetical protein GCM10007416_22210 [Kroppenstedtia guangzhouensis]|uniref:DUF2269 family protein n=1 Tax=Kroppenstedtia guangzhouensis TaxID=1274356 RepID=A0ABQ1GQW7_9BACL|nr:hypothetical protein [Kroppenstedtia guangzhouensis]GGA48622.1 hypothetical protein GCM10007416_22210 [Kroppenstedtia guangzhouensis]
MGYKIALFVHVLSIASWFGGLAVMAVWLRKSTKLHDAGISMDQSLKNVHNLNVRMMVPVAILSFIAGLYMLIQFGDSKPLYLVIKERFGSLIVLAYVIGFPIYGGRLFKKLQGETDPAAKVARVKGYINLLNLTLLLLAFIILVVTFKFQ